MQNENHLHFPLQEGLYQKIELCREREILTQMSPTQAQFLDGKKNSVMQFIGLKRSM